MFRFWAIQWLQAVHEEKKIWWNFDFLKCHIWVSLWVRGVSGIIVVSPQRLCNLKTVTRRALSRRVIMLAGACLARSGLARRALDTNFSFNLGWYFEYFSKSDNSKQLVPVRNLYSKILRIRWFQGKSNWTFRFWEIQWLQPFMRRKFWLMHEKNDVFQMLLKSIQEHSRSHSGMPRHHFWRFRAQKTT